MKKYFITGISTEVGKTIVSAILTEALNGITEAIQSGDLDYGDTDKIKALISNKTSVFHKNSYALNTPMSPHASATIDGVEISLKKIKEPKTENHLVIEGAGGLLVPLNDKETIIDLIKPDYEVILVSRHYLGSINHTLLTINALRAKGLNCKIRFSGNEHPSTEAIIKTQVKLKLLDVLKRNTLIKCRFKYAKIRTLL